MPPPPKIPPSSGAATGFADPANCSKLEARIKTFQGDLSNLENSPTPHTGKLLQSIQLLQTQLSYLSTQWQTQGCMFSVPVPAQSHFAIRVLLVLDDLTTFGPGARLAPVGSPFNDGFGLSTVIDTLTNSEDPAFVVHKVHRDVDALHDWFAANPDEVDTLRYKPETEGFRFTVFDDAGLAWYDEIWMIGFSGAGNANALTDDELKLLAKFMNSGRGVFATGDHSDLGSAMNQFVPRVRAMRRWDPSDPSLPPVSGSDRLDTLQPGHSDLPPAGGVPQLWFDDQSDDVPQQISLLVPNHPLVCLPLGRRLNLLPDHMHEGEVVVNPNGVIETPVTLPKSNGQLQVDGINFVEFPGSERPVVVANGRVSRHATEVQQLESAHGGAQSFPTTNARPFGVIGAYDGQADGVGRVVVESTFHHLFDINLVGDAQAVPQSDGIVYNPKNLGFQATPSGRAALADITQYFINIAVWLAPMTTKANLYVHRVSRIAKSHQLREMLATRQRNFGPRDERFFGNVAIQTLARTTPEWSIIEMVLAHAGHRNLAVGGDGSIRAGGIDLGFMLEHTLGASIIEFDSYWRGAVVGVAGRPPGELLRPAIARGMANALTEMRRGADRTLEECASLERYIPSDGCAR